LAVCDRVDVLPETYSIAEGGGLLAAATPKGVWRSTDQGRTWEPASAGIPSGTGKGGSGEPHDPWDWIPVLAVFVIVGCIAVLIRRRHHASSRPPDAGRQVLDGSLSSPGDLARATGNDLNLENSVDPQRTLNIFISYAHEDEDLKVQLEKRLKGIRRDYPIEIWSDRQMLAGTPIHAEILKRLEAADITLLLISPDFVTSDYCWTTEMQIALQQYELVGKVFVPIIVRLTTEWHKSRLGQHLALPKDGKPLAEWSNADAFWGNVELGLRNLIRHQLGIAE
jgi:hypothetical protein